MKKGGGDLPGDREARPYCYRCDKPASMCVCRHLTPIQNAVGVHVLQHPRERRHPLGTARLLRLGLAEVRVHALDLSGGGGVSAPEELPDGAGLLYPSEDALDLTTLAAGEGPSHLVVLDGTWGQAHTLFRDNPWISALPRYRLPEGEGSRYRIRLEPRLECLSTVESVVAALRILEPDLRDTETLLLAFEAMIDAQIEAYADESTRSPRFQVRKRIPRPVPDVLLRPDARIVVVFTEAAPRRTTVSKTKAPFRISAVSLDGTRVFDRLLSTTPAPDAYLAERMGLDLAVVDTGDPSHDVMAAFREFCGASSPGAPLVLVAWNAKTFRWFEESMGDVPCVPLKGVWANLTQIHVPELATLVNSLGLAPEDLPVVGRAGQRLTNAHAMARHIVDGAAHAR